MATKFVKNQVVRLNSVVPQGPIQALRMTEDGEFFYLMEWVDDDGETQQRWFPESTLVAVE
jgi:hypothetical protein